jgi:retron-type reverse transcriptase
VSDLHYIKHKLEAWKIACWMYSIRYLHLHQLKLLKYFGFLIKTTPLLGHGIRNLVKNYSK